MQKSFCVDFRTHQQKPNQGELPKYYVENSHDPIQLDIRIRRKGHMKAFNTALEAQGNGVYKSGIIVQIRQIGQASLGGNRHCRRNKLLTDRFCQTGFFPHTHIRIRIMYGVCSFTGQRSNDTIIVHLIDSILHDDIQLKFRRSSWYTPPCIIYTRQSVQ